MADSEPPADGPGVIAPPLVIFAAFLVLGLGLEWASPSGIALGLLPRLLGTAPMAAGAALIAWSMRRFRRSDTTINPYGATRVIVSDGPYRFSRNPIYAALVLIYAGAGVLAASPWVLGLLVPCVVVMRYGVIAREERYLEKRFGDGYRRYKRSVRRWL